MARLPDSEKLILEQAVRWYAWLRDHRADPEQVDVFQRWRAKSPRHRAAFDRVDDLWRHCDAIDPLDLPWPTEPELQLDRYDGSRPLPLPEGRNPLLDRSGTAGAAAAGFVLGEKPAAARRPRARWRVAAAAGLAAVLVALASPLVMDRPGVPRPVPYSTGIAQQRMEPLPDGSTVTLGGGTRLSVYFDQSSRRVVLERGEAFFEVARDPSRAFRVEVGGSEVTAVGTAFNINRLRDAVSVSVLEGVVDVSSGAGADAAPGKRERLHQGEALVYDREGGVWQRRGEEALQRARGWREGRLAFVNEPLERVLQDVNRYSERTIVAGDRSLAALRFTGTIFSNDIDDWLDGLERAFKVRVLEVDGRIVLLNNS